MLDLFCVFVYTFVICVCSSAWHIANLDLIFVASLSDGIHEYVHAFVVGLIGRGKAALNADDAGILANLPLDDRFGEVRATQDHELQEG